MEAKLRSTKKCPRCGEKALLASQKCNECGLVFARLNKASNAEGKRKLKNKEKEKVLFVSSLPNDVSKLKLLLFCIFGGYLGLHSFYVGRYLRASYSFLCFLILLVIVVFQIDLIWSGYDTFMSFFSIFGGIAGIMWFYDIILVSINKFKVPIALKSE
ncbi:MAG: hypothetical protein WCR30_00840 [Clostridia bacterium]